MRQPPPTKNPSATRVHFGLNLPRPGFGIGFGVKGGVLVWVTHSTDLDPPVARPRFPIPTIPAPDDLAFSLRLG